MKKITAFFMAFMPLLITILLFAAGLIVKNQTHVYVSAVELTHDSLVVQKTDEKQDKNITLEARVLPLNATNPDLYWTSSNEDVLTVNNEGLVSCKKFGEAFVYATSKENQTISSSCKIEVNDQYIHSVVVSDEDKYDVAYVGLNDRKQIKTHIIPATGVIDPTLVYEVDNDSKDYVDITQDGLILPKKQTEAGKKAKIKIHPATGPYVSRVTEVDIQIGPGVEQLCLKDQTQSVTSSSTYNVFEQLNTYPETNVSATDFTYTSDNEDVATINENGIATFKKNLTANFTATYKRNNLLSVNKSVYSTSDSIVDVNFNCDSYTQNIEYKDGAYVSKELDSDKFYCDVYPQVTSNTKYEIVSSDPDVILPQKQENGTYKYIAKRPGCVMLYAYANQEGLEKVVDACYVTVTSITDNKDLGLIKTSTVSLPAGTFYYPLINSLNLQADKRSPYAISYAFSKGGDIADIDTNGILHFKSAGEAIITVKIDNLPTGTITVTSSNKIALLDVKDQLVISAGKKYSFNNATPVFASKSYESYFDVDGNTFIPRNGCNIQEFELTTQTGTKKINLIVKEDPIYIKNSKSVFFTTELNQYNYKKEGSISIVPSTATKEDGSKYTLDYSYQFSNNSIKVENDDITFSDEGVVEVTTKTDNLHLNSWFKSTNGRLSKFELIGSEGKVKSNQEVTYKGTDLVYTVSNLTYTQAEAIKCETISGDELFNIDVTMSETSTDVYQVKFTIKPKSTLYGTEVIAITNRTYTIYLNIVLPATVTDVELMYGRETLHSWEESITSYVQNLTLDVIPYPALPSVVSAKDAYTATLNDKQLPITNNQISIDLNQGTILKIYAKGSSEPLKTYTFKYETDWSKLRISMSGVDENNNIYMGSKETKKILYLKANGLVPHGFFETDKFKVNLNTTGSEQATMQQDVLTITNLPKPDGSEYSLGLTLMYDTHTLGQYKLTRDIVSKIVLPKHDNADMTDKKGMQKVHVYGNKSYYNPTEKLIEGYRLPIEIYDYKGDLIVNTAEKPNLKAQAIKTLNISINKNCDATYDEVNDCILVKFAKDTLYDETEISQNLFDAKDGAKNVTFNIASKSNIANAKYTFVAVDGANVYCQEGLQQADGTGKEHGEGTVVLQTNFGVEGLEKDNTKFEIALNCVGGIYGNGYTMCATYLAEKSMSDFYLGMHFAFNTVFEGLSDSAYTKTPTDKDHNINLRNMEHYKKSYFMYCVYKNFSYGMAYDLINDPQPTTIKNSLFYNCKIASLSTNKEEADGYIENCVFFDCGGLPLSIGNGGFHFKGYVGIYNFHNKEAFKDIFGYDLTALWPTVESAAKNANMTEVGADGRLYVNFFMANAMTEKFYFWNSKTKEYEQGEAGTPDAANFIAKFIDLKIPFTSINASMWATYNRTVDPASFSYYDEFDENGEKRIDFLANQIAKLVRKPIYF